MRTRKNSMPTVRPAAGLIDKRVAAMLSVLAIATGVTLLVGYDMTAAGIAAGTPLALSSHYVMQRTVRKAEQLTFAAGTRRILLVSFGRTLFGMAALLAALQMGVEFMIGMLLALVSESLGYLVGLLGRQGRG